MAQVSKGPRLLSSVEPAWQTFRRLTPEEQFELVVAWYQHVKKVSDGASRMSAIFAKELARLLEESDISKGARAKLESAQRAVQAEAKRRAALNVNRPKGSAAVKDRSAALTKTMGDLLKVRLTQNHQLTAKEFAGEVLERGLAKKNKKGDPHSLEYLTARVRAMMKRQ
jgi:hypothetical protein